MADFNSVASQGISVKLLVSIVIVLFFAVTAFVAAINPVYK
jgi:hypothetical protein